MQNSGSAKQCSSLRHEKDKNKVNKKMMQQGIILINFSCLEQANDCCSWKFAIIKNEDMLLLLVG